MGAGVGDVRSKEVGLALAMALGTTWRQGVQEGRRSAVGLAMALGTVPRRVGGWRVIGGLRTRVCVSMARQDMGAEGAGTNYRDGSWGRGVGWGGVKRGGKRGVGG